jgi:cellulase/cellobiase CelA1
MRSPAGAIAGEYFALQVVGLYNDSLPGIGPSGISQDQAAGSRPKAAECGNLLLHFDKLA